VRPKAGGALKFERKKREAYPTFAEQNGIVLNLIDAIGFAEIIQQIAGVEQIHRRVRTNLSQRQQHSTIAGRRSGM
jgi:hypothetical protein